MYRRQIISQQAQNICITFLQRRPNVFDVGPTFVCYTNVLCWLGMCCRVAWCIGHGVHTSMIHIHTCARTDRSHIFTGEAYFMGLDVLFLL